MTMRRRAAAASLLAAGLLLAMVSACGGDGSATTTAVAGVNVTGPIDVGTPAKAATYLRGLPSAGWVEPTPASDRDRLLAQTSEINDVCQVIQSIDGADAADPTDLDAMAQWANIDYASLQSLDPSKEFADLVTSIGTIQKSPPPKEVVGDIATERAEIFAYRQRLNLGQQLVANGSLTGAAVQAWMDEAYRALVLSGFDKTDRELTQFAQDRCEILHPIAEAAG